MTRPKYVASCSGGKDSVATLLLAAQHKEPLDEAVFSEVMFDQDTSGEVPEHRDFIYDRLKPFCEKELGIKFTILHADKTYDDVFHHVITRGPHKGEVRGFAWADVRSQSGLQNPARPKVQCRAFSGHRELCRHRGG